MLTGNQRSYLKGIANGIDPILQIGKKGITENFVTQVDEALEAREIVKINVLDNSFLEPKKVANELCTLTDAEFVQSIGSKITLYRESKENKKIELP